MKSSIIITVMVAVIAVLLFVSLSQDDIYSPATIHSIPETEILEEKITVATCPTFYYLFEGLEKNNINVVKTNFTAESLHFLQKNEVDLIVTGRKLKPEEPQFLSEIIGFGYSFISDREFLIQEKEMGNYNFFTDLSSSEILDNFSYISPEKISEVENVYNYLNQGVVITSAENTDYSKSEIVHIYREDGSRHRFSRTPIIYYSSFLDKSVVQNFISNALNGRGGGI